jgi:hypothetical protein
MTEMNELRPTTPPAEPPEAKRKRGPKSKPITMTVTKCEDRQWRDFREAAYPLLLKFGLFDHLPNEVLPDDRHQAA